MKILVMSDSHGRIGRLKDIISDNKDARSIIFLGDGEREFDLAATEMNLREHAQVVQVCGNCDRMSQEEVTVVREIEGVKFYITHGYEQNVKYGLEKLYYAACEAGCKVALFGHTHRQHLSEEDDIAFFNPGSVENGEYGIIKIEGKEIAFEHKSI